MSNRKLRAEKYLPPNSEPGKTTVERRKVGPADPATRRKRLKEALEATERPPPKPKATPSAENPTRDLTLTQAARNLRAHKKRLQDLGE